MSSNYIILTEKSTFGCLILDFAYIDFVILVLTYFFLLKKGREQYIKNENDIVYNELKYEKEQYKLLCKFWEL